MGVTTAAAVIALSTYANFVGGNEDTSIPRTSGGYSPTFAEGNVEGWKECVDDISDKRFENESVASAKPFSVHLAWSTYELKSQALAEFEIVVTNSTTGVPLSEVTYDFTYKSARDLGGLQDRYVVDFSNGADTFQLQQVKYPCDLHFIVSVDKVGSQSFLRTDPEEIARFGNASPVHAEFRMVKTDTGTIEMIAVQ